MADASSPIKHPIPINGGYLLAELKSICTLLRTRKIVALGYAFMFAFVAVTVFIAFSPSSNSTAPWFTNIFGSSTSTASSGSQFSSIYSFFYPAPPQQPPLNESSSLQVQNTTTVARSNATVSSQASQPPSIYPEVEIPSGVQNHTQNGVDSSANPSVLPANQTGNSSIANKEPSFFSNRTQSTQNSTGVQGLISNLTSVPPPKAPAAAAVENQTSSVNSTTESVPLKKEKSKNEDKDSVVKSLGSNYTASLPKKQNSGTKQSNATNLGKPGTEDLVQNLVNCDLFDGMWVMDDSYPLYKPGSCSLIDEQFNCITNGRPDKDYQKYKWKPNGCTLPRLNAGHMLEMLRGKRLAFVGDSLNRNMWESLICILKSSVKDQSKVFEAHGRNYFRGEASYSFIFKDYGCTIEFFVSPFLVQESEVSNKSGAKKETLRLDLVGRSADHYKNADIIVFNTGHWWTHDKTSKGKDYYQEGSHVYGELNVREAFRKAITTWGRWIDEHINPSKTFVLFRGYSHSHFRGGQWNSGGGCDSEVEPIKNATFLREYEPKMMILEKVLKNMKTHVAYLNVTQMTDYRKDGHPSIYRKKHLTDVETHPQLHSQDCSHWCLPGVPDAWNEILYTELLINEKQKKQQVQKKHR